MEARRNWKKAFTVALFGIAGIFALWFSLVAFENYRGRAAWKRYGEAALARGELPPFTAPVPIPDSENFAATPFFQELFRGEAEAKAARRRIDLEAIAKEEDKPSDGRWAFGKTVNFNRWKAYLGTDHLCETLAQFAPIIDEIAAASHRPGTRFPLNYGSSYTTKQPHLGALEELGQLLALRAKLSLHEGKPEQALADLKLMFRLSDAAFSYQSLYGFTTKSAILRRSIGVIWEGLAFQRWKRPEVEGIKVRLQKYNLIHDYTAALQTEQAVSNQHWRHYFSEGLRSASSTLKHRFGLSLIPVEGWLLQNQIKASRHYQKMINVLRQRPINISEVPFKSSASGIYWLGAESQFALTDLVSPRIFFTNSAIQQALIACALEGYRMDHGNFPEDLDALVPRYLASIPIDPLTTKPQNYRRTDDGSYLLYSVGWNLKDDGGTVAIKFRNWQDYTQGDWVWYGTPQK